MTLLRTLTPFVLVLSLATACDDTVFEPAEGGGPIGSTGFCGVEELFQSDCVQCHSEAGAAGGLNLETNLEQNLLVDGTFGYPLVVPNDSAGSLIVQKVKGTQPDDAGGSMPPGSSISTEKIELLEAWITDGASFECGDPTGTGTGTETGTTGQTTPTTATTSNGYCAVENIISANCLTCHSAASSQGNLDLETDLASTLFTVGQYGVPLIVANNPDGSLLLQKMLNTQQNSEGGVMPPGGVIASTQTDKIAQWITDGATPVCAGTTTTTTTTTAPYVLEPESPIDVGDPPCQRGNPNATTNCLFEDTPPGFVTDTTCYTGNWWQEPGSQHDGSWMKPGHACIQCHTNSNDGPSYSYAGTVHGGADDADDCQGIPGVTVEILDINDNVIATEVTNEAGNFGVYSNNVSFEQFRVRLSYSGRVREMWGHATTTGDCATCHTPTGTSGAPGRIVAP